MRKHISAIVIVLAVALLLAGPHLTLAQSSSDIQAQIDQIESQRQELLKEQAELQSKLSTTAAQKQTLQNAINALNLSKSKLQNDLKITQSHISSASLTIQKLGNSISQNEATIANNKSAIEESLRKLQSYDGRSIAYDLLSYGSLTEVWNDTANLLDTQDALASSINTLEASQKDLAANKSSQEAQKSDLISYQAQLNGQKAAVDSTTQAKAALLAETKSQESSYQKLLADNQAREKQFEDQLFQFQSQLKAAPPSAAPSAKHGLLSWPLATIRITQQFGKTADSGRLYASGTHSGTDFGAPVGTAVMSAGNGVVAGMGNTDDEKSCYSYGRWLFIKYNNGLSSIYGHLTSITVSVGTAVTAGQVVGYSGGAPGAYGSGYSTGPHLHMGLFNSAGVSIQQYVSSIGCKNVSIPLANPQDYLDPMAYLPAL